MRARPMEAGSAAVARGKPPVLFGSLQGLNPTAVGRDVIAGLTLAAITIPEQMATAKLGGFAPQVEASVPQPLAKADRLDIRPVGRDCSEQAWPNFEASCLRRAGTKADVREARLVSADRST